MLEEFGARWQTICDRLSEVIVGQDRLIREVLTAIFAGGHVLVEGPPGLGKTLLIRTLAHTLELGMRRVSCTPDLMPADILGGRIFMPATGEFLFETGPIFTHLLLADELNRTTPRTQAALLEAMQEGAVTIAGERRPLPDPFFVMATQNPIELEGTYPLPEAQLDRFMLKCLVGPVSGEELVAILGRTTGPDRADALAPPEADGDGAAGLLSVRGAAREVGVPTSVAGYVARLVTATNPETSPLESVRRYVRFGASPRAGQALILCAKVRALAGGRPAIDIGDVRAYAHAALRHRLLLSFDGEAAGASSESLIDELLEHIPSSTAAG